MNLCKTVRLLQPFTFYKRNLFSWNKSKSVANLDERADQPFKFLGTDAHNFNPRIIRFQKSWADHPGWKFSIWVFTLYGLIFYLTFFRPRNDLDDELEMPLGKRVLQIKEMLLMDEINKLKTSGGSGKAYERDLAEIHRLRTKYGYDK